MATCEMIDVAPDSPGPHGDGVPSQWPCRADATGISEDGVRCCDRHAKGMREEGFRVDPLQTAAGRVVEVRLRFWLKRLRDYAAELAATESPKPDGRR